MREEGIRQFLVALGVPWGKMHVSRKWVNCPCPMAPYMHGAGTDEHPSFGISIREDGRSSYYCFGCSTKSAWLERLLHNMWLMTKDYPVEAARIFIREEIFAEEEEVADVPDAWVEDHAEPMVAALPHRVTAQFPPLQFGDDDVAAACRKYLVGRGIPEIIQNLYQVRYDPARGCLVFALTNVRGEIYALRERSIEEKRFWMVTAEMSHEKGVFPKLTQIGVWFGMHLIDWRKPVVLVEGELDKLRLAALGEFNVVASGGSEVTDAQLQALSAGTLFLGYDSDPAGIRAHHRISGALRGKAMLFELKWASVNRKDAGALKDRKEWLTVFDNAEPI